MQPLVTIVIVVWNGLEDTLECLRSLNSHDYKNKEVVLVDNGSTDGTAERVKQEGFPVTVLSCPLNLGFTGGNNVGLAEARRRGAKYAFLLNNDTTLKPDALGKLVGAAESCKDAALLSPVVHYYDMPGEVWFSGAKLSLSRGEALHENLERVGECRRFNEPPGCSSPPYATDWVSGCAVLVRMEAVETVGGFDDRFFLTWEDVDWSVRMRRANWEVLVVPEAQIYHKCGKSGARLSGIHRYYAVRNSLLLAAKHAGPFYLSALIYILGRHLRSAFRADRPERTRNFATIFEGLRDHLLGRYGRRPAATTAGGPNCSSGLENSQVAGEKACVSSK